MMHAPRYSAMLGWLLVAPQAPAVDALPPVAIDAGLVSVRHDVTGSITSLAQGIAEACGASFHALGEDGRAAAIPGGRFPISEFLDRLGREAHGLVVVYDDGTETRVPGCPAEIWLMGRSGTTGNAASAPDLPERQIVNVLWEYGDEPFEGRLPSARERVAMIQSAADGYGGEAGAWLQPVVTWDPDPAVRSAAVEAARRIGGDLAWNVIGLALEDISPEVRATALLAQRGAPEGEPWDVVESLATGDESPLVRKVAVDMLAERDSQESLDSLRRATGDTDSAVRAAALKALGLRNEAE